MATQCCETHFRGSSSNLAEVLFRRIFYIFITEHVEIRGFCDEKSCYFQSKMDKGWFFLHKIVNGGPNVDSVESFFVQVPCSEMNISMVKNDRISASLAMMKHQCEIRSDHVSIRQFAHFIGTWMRHSCREIEENMIVFIFHDLRFLAMELPLWYFSGEKSLFVILEFTL